MMWKLKFDVKGTNTMCKLKARMEKGGHYAV